jgi:hypothetical protein
MYQVTDRAGNLIELPDDQVLPDGCRVYVSPTSMFLDAEQKLTLSMLGHRDNRSVTRQPDLSDGAAAYERHKKWLGAPKAKRAPPMPPGQPFQVMPKRKRRVILAGAADGKPQPQWVGRTGGNMPAIGPSGSSPPLRGVYGDAGAQARARYIHKISNAWRDHRR